MFRLVLILFESPGVVPGAFAFYGFPLRNQLGNPIRGGLFPFGIFN